MQNNLVFLDYFLSRSSKDHRMRTVIAHINATNNQKYTRDTPVTWYCIEIQSQTTLKSDPCQT